ncbi:LPXTG cell wall anchor domain-containing protein [Actinoplanes sp. KI2]|uniref:LPXTG cell wall anchor domain-containing protein n=1 Tax=Actinoplanes sp. KI2 TaxID=2983315 RepID=UPI0029500468|nr:LPXTG cell wall anchor domain-containing protein [Actinoplanes sp. KI2]
MALALLVPAAPVAAQTAPPGLNAACQTVERKVYEDIRKLVTIDLDTATDVQVRILANQILAEATAESLSVLPDAVQKGLDGTPDDLRTFLKTGLSKPWSTALRVAVDQTLTGAGTNVKAAAQKALDDETIDAYLAYLNDGLYAARALDCAPKPPTTPSATTTAAVLPTSSAGPTAGGGKGAALPETGADTGTVAAIGGALLLIGGTGYLLARRRRSRFVA